MWLKTCWRRAISYREEFGEVGSSPSLAGSARSASATAQSCGGNSGKILIGWNSIGGTCGVAKFAALGNLADARTFPTRHAGANSTTGLLFTNENNRRLRDAHRAGCSADGGCSPQALWRNRAGSTLADRGTGGAGTRRHLVCQRRFADLSKT